MINAILLYEYDHYIIIILAFDYCMILRDIFLFTAMLATIGKDVFCLAYSS